jgi:hypothetical protein
MDKDPAQINRWLGAPKNVEIETLSHLLLAMGYVPRTGSDRLSDLYRSNHFETDDVVDRGSTSATNKTQTKTQFGEPVSLPQ